MLHTTPQPTNSHEYKLFSKWAPCDFYCMKCWVWNSARVSSQRHGQFSCCSTELPAGRRRYRLCLIREWKDLNPSGLGPAELKIAREDLKIRLPRLCNAYSSASLQHMLFVAPSPSPLRVCIYWPCLSFFDLALPGYFDVLFSGIF